MMGWQWYQLNHLQAICTSLQKITTPAPHHSDFYGPDALPGTHQQRQSTEGPCIRSSFSLYTNGSCRPLCVSTLMRPLYRFIYNNGHEAIHQTHHYRLVLLYVYARHNTEEDLWIVAPPCSPRDLRWLTVHSPSCYRYSIQRFVWLKSKPANCTRWHFAKIAFGTYWLWHLATYLGLVGSAWGSTTTVKNTLKM